LLKLRCRSRKHTQRNCVIPRPPWGQFVKSLGSAEVKSATCQDTALNWIEEGQSNAVEVTFENKIFRDARASDLLEHVKLTNPELMIIETHESSFKARVLGSLSSHLANKSLCPILLYNTGTALKNNDQTEPSSE
jgi:hypothetical protein